MSHEAAPDEKLMRLRYAGACCICDIALPAGTKAIYRRDDRTVRCPTHVGPPEAGPVPEPVIDSGTPGASARREFERRQARREARIRDRHPRIGGLLHALSDEPQSTRAWETGAAGEERLGHRLGELSSNTLRVLHDRRIPGTRANIDHLAVSQSGIYVIDAKKYAGRPHLKVDGGLLHPRVEKLMVGRRDCTKVVDGVVKQVAAVSAAIGAAVPVRGVLCFVGADWPLIGGAFTTRDVQVLWPKRLYPKLVAGGSLDSATISELHRQLASALRPA